jgi:hypothetical protein
MRLDLHRHLEGSHSPRALRSVAEMLGLKDPLFYEAGQYRSEAALARELTLEAPSDDASLFYDCIKKARAAYVSVEAIGMLAELAFTEAAAECDGLEMRVSLFSMTRTLLERQGQDWRAVAPVDFARTAGSVLAAILSARDVVRARLHRPMLVRLGLSRTFESEPHYRALIPVIGDQAGALCGLDVLGIVTGGDREPMPAALVQILGELRGVLPDLTIHAGEFEGHGSVDRTLALAPQAIGHGVHAIESARTLSTLRDRGVTLEVCPESNRLLIPTALRTLTALRGAHPLVVLQRERVRAVLGSDDPTPMGTTFGREWQAALALGADAKQLEADVARRWKQLPGHDQA